MPDACRTFAPLPLEIFWLSAFLILSRVSNGGANMKMELTAATCLPQDHQRALLVGRLWLPQVRGPVLVKVKGDDVFDLSGVAPTSSHLFELADPVARAGAAQLPRIASLAELLAPFRR
jgi:hypothetical protein